MPVGEIKAAANAKKAVKILEGATATSAAPSTANDGVPVYPTNQIAADDGHCYAAQAALTSTLMVNFASGASASVRLWGYLAASGAWYPIDASATALTANGVVRYNDLGHYDRLYLQVTAITTSNISAWLVTSRTVSL